MTRYLESFNAAMAISKKLFTGIASRLMLSEEYAHSPSSFDLQDELLSIVVRDLNEACLTFVSCLGCYYFNNYLSNSDLTSNAAPLKNQCIVHKIGEQITCFIF